MPYAPRLYRQIQRRKSRQIMVGNVPVGGDAPITVQSMTNTLTSDVAATVAQIHALEKAGADIVRVHDVRENVRTARVADAILRGWRPDGWTGGASR